MIEDYLCCLRKVLQTNHRHDKIKKSITKATHLPRGYSSVVEHLVANENVARSNRVTRFQLNLLESKTLGGLVFSGCIEVFLNSRLDFGFRCERYLVAKMSQ